VSEYDKNMTSHATLPRVSDEGAAAKTVEVIEVAVWRKDLAVGGFLAGAVQMPLRRRHRSWFRWRRRWNPRQTDCI